MSERAITLPQSLRERFAGREDIDLRTPTRGLTVRNRDGLIREARATAQLEARATEDGVPRLVGYASTYDDPYDIGVPIDQGGWGWTEIIAKGAATRSINNSDDVYLFFNHDGFDLASTKNGSLRLSSNSIGLLSEAELDPASPYSMEVYRRVQRRSLTQMSFAFQVVRERWEDRQGNEASFVDAPVRRILEVKLFDTSVVSFPANPGTSVDVKSASEPGGMTVEEARAMLAEIRRDA